MSKVVTTQHQQIFDAVPSEAQQFLQVHAVTKTVSRICFKKGGYRAAMAYYGAQLRTDNHQIVLRHLEEMVTAIIPQGVKYDAKKEMNGYLGVHVYLGTWNVNEFFSWVNAQKENS
jgi:hypothetical protein